jgi:hypothetical protein
MQEVPQNTVMYDGYVNHSRLTASCYKRVAPFAVGIAIAVSIAIAVWVRQSHRDFGSKSQNAEGGTLGTAFCDATVAACDGAAMS